MKTQMQKFIPEGWDETQQNLNLQQLQTAMQNGTVLQGTVQKCDENCNLQICFGENLIGTIPKNEVDAVTIDNLGITKPSICKNKVGKLVQFKVKEIDGENKVILSRKEVRKRSFELDRKRIRAGNSCESELLEILENLVFLWILEEELRDCYILRIFQFLA